MRTGYDQTNGDKISRDRILSTLINSKGNGKKEYV